MNNRGKRNRGGAVDPANVAIPADVTETELLHAEVAKLRAENAQLRADMARHISHANDAVSALCSIKAAVSVWDNNK